MCVFLLPVEFAQQSTFSCFHFYVEKPARHSQTYQISFFSCSSSQFRCWLLHLWKESVLQKISANICHRFIDIWKCNQLVINKQNNIPYWLVGSLFFMFLKIREPDMETDIFLSLAFWTVSFFISIETDIPIIYSSPTCSWNTCEIVGLNMQV
jgi:hypothetical protein